MVTLHCAIFLVTLSVLIYSNNAAQGQQCRSDQFSCHNNLCIPHSWKCDGANDCSDSSDEQDCGNRRFGCGSSSLFQCQNNKCILKSWACDGQDDCGDNSDEREQLCGKKKTCRNFTCDNGKCLSSTWLCDNFDDCGDQSDERGCSAAAGPTAASTGISTTNATTKRQDTTTVAPSRCMSTEFECRVPSTCIPNVWKCDGANDCQDGSDESDCGASRNQESVVSPCSLLEFYCDNKCMPASWKCDNYSDCNDKTDEEFCGSSLVTSPAITQNRPTQNIRALGEPISASPTTAVVCSASEFRCASGNECTFDAWKCDGDNDCTDGSDEQNCGTTSPRLNQQAECSDGYFTCHTSRRCIANSWVCDRERDCLDGSDEFNCVKKASLFVATGARIVQLPEDLSSSEIAFRSLVGAVAIDADVQKEEIYYSDVRRRQIKKGYLNGRHQEVIISRDLGIVEGIAVDWIGRKLYWTDSLASTIEVSELGGQKRKKLVTKGLSNPRAIVVHPSGYLYWSEWGGQPKISRISMDGKPETRRILIDKRIVWPNALTIEYDVDYLWWADAKLGKIERCNLDGTNRRIMKRNNVGSPFSLAVSSRYIYVSNLESGRVERFEKQSWNTRKVMSPAFSQKATGITLIHGEKQKAVNTACSNNNGGCSHLCVLSSGRSRYSCLCPDNLRLDINGRSCVPRIAASCSSKQFRCDGNICIDVSRQCDGRQDCDDGTDEQYCLSNPTRLVFGNRKHHLGVCTLRGGKRCSHFRAVEKTASIIGLDVDVKNGIVFWADSIKNAIMKSVLKADGSILWTKTVTDKYVYTPEGLAFDWVTNKIYWIDAFLRKIEVIDTDGTYRYTIVKKKLYKPRSIALHPKSGYLFWTDWGSRPCLAKIAMDGNPDTRRKVVETGIRQPNSITIDYSRDQLYWVDAALDKVERMDINGGARTVFLKNGLLRHPFSLLFYENFLYWSDWRTQAILRIGMDGKRDSIVRKRISKPMEFAIFDKYRQSALPNPCALYNGGCSHICLINPISGSRRSCKCPKTMRLRKNKMSCQSLYRRNDRRYLRTNSLYDIGLL